MASYWWRRFAPLGPRYASLGVASGGALLAGHPLWCCRTQVESEGPVSAPPKSIGGCSIPSPAASWTRNLIFLPPSGFWEDSEWYDLHLERRLPESAMALREIVWALPPLSGCRVADLGSGTGRSALAIAAAYPTADLTLLDVDKERGTIAVNRLQQQTVATSGKGVSPRVRFIPCTLGGDCSVLPESEGGYDCVVALQAVRHIVAPAPHYAQKHGLQIVSGEPSIWLGYNRVFRGIYNSLVPGGHIFLGDHVVHGHPGVFEQCELLKESGFMDVDVAWRFRDWFVVGARRPPSRN